MTNDHLRLEQHDIANTHGDSIRTDVRYIESESKKPIIIICHSFMAFKNWGFFPYLAEQIARSGYISVIFNFSLNGVAGDGTRITDFERFASNTFTRELEDINTIVGLCSKRVFASSMADEQKIGLVGHSRGGGIAIVHAASDANVKALATLSSIATFDRWREHQKNEWKKSGFLPLARDSHVSPLRLGRELLRDVENNAETLSITGAASRLRKPWLILHGKADGTVHPKEAETLYQSSDKSKTRLVLLEHAGHLFNAVSPDEDQYRTLNNVIEITLHFFKQML